MTAIVLRHRTRNLLIAMARQIVSMEKYQDELGADHQRRHARLNKTHTQALKRLFSRNRLMLLELCGSCVPHKVAEMEMFKDDGKPFTEKKS